MRYSYLVIEGNIGAGKTSLARMIAEKYKAKLILEKYEDVPFLSEFYKDPVKYSFPLEISFLTARFNQLNRELSAPDSFKPFLIADYLFRKSLIFAGVTLQKDEFSLYTRLFNIINRNLPEPDLLVYLHVSVNQLLNNIKKRGRDYEQNISTEYLEKIHEGYMTYLKSRNDIKILIIEMDQIDFINKQEDFSRIDDMIFRSEIKFGLNRFIST